MVTLLASCPALGRRAEEPVQDDQHICCAFVADAVEECLGLAPEGHQPLVAKLGQMLRQSRWLTPIFDTSAPTLISSSAMR